MPNITRLWRWHRWEPGLGGNLELPEAARFYLDLGVGLTKTELDTLTQSPDLPLTLDGLEGDAMQAAVTAWRASMAKAWAEKLGNFVRMGKEPLTLDGAPVASLADYLSLLWQQPGLLDWNELVTTLVRLNGIEGGREVFYARLSGGSSGTARAA